MAQFTPSKKTAQDFNGGQKYINGEGTQTGDMLTADMPNNVIESQLWTQALAENPVDNSDADNVGTAAVTVELMPDGTPRFKVSNIKGKQGVGIVSISPNGVDANGNNKYIITMSDGTTYNITAPKGDKGDKGNDGNSILATNITYAVSNFGTTIPPDAAWQNEIPAVGEGQYLWTRTMIVYDKTPSTISYTVAYQGINGVNGVPGTNGTNGRGVSSTTIDYVMSTSGTVVPGSGWSTTIPTLAQGQYLWTRTTFTYTDNTTSKSYSIAYQGMDAQTGTVGSSTEPVYLSGGTLTKCSRTIPSITLNGSANTIPSFYAPTTAGTSGYILKSNGSGAPTWINLGSGEIIAELSTITTGQKSFTKSLASYKYILICAGYNGIWVPFYMPVEQFKIFNSSTNRVVLCTDVQYMSLYYVSNNAFNIVDKSTQASALKIYGYTL